MNNKHGIFQKLKSRLKNDSRASTDDCNLKTDNLNSNVPNNIPENVELNPQKVNIFHRQTPKKGFMDIWWLYDDGGKFAIYIIFYLKFLLNL